MYSDQLLGPVVLDRQIPGIGQSLKVGCGRVIVDMHEATLWMRASTHLDSSRLVCIGVVEA
jgi:hypothetical protein